MVTNVIEHFHIFVTALTSRWFNNMTFQFSRKIILLFGLFVTSCGGNDADAVSKDMTSVVLPISPNDTEFLTHLDQREKLTMLYPKEWSRHSYYYLSDDNLLAVFIEPSRQERFK